MVLLNFIFGSPENPLKSDEEINSILNCDHRDIKLESDKKLNEYKEHIGLKTINEADIEGYNDVSNFYTLSDTIFPDTVPINGNTLYLICYNKQFNTAIIIENSLQIKDQLKTLFPELHILLEVDNTKKMKISVLREKLKTHTFLNDIECIEYLDDILYKKGNRRITTNDIRDTINRLYQITDDTNHKIKFTDMYNSLKKYMNLNDDNSQILRNTLPNVLLEINLKKKRYTTGIYYYGCLEKETEAKVNADQFLKYFSKCVPLNDLRYSLDIIDVNKNVSKQNCEKTYDTDDDVDDKVKIEK